MVLPFRNCTVPAPAPEIEPPELFVREVNCNMPVDAEQSCVSDGNGIQQQRRARDVGVHDSARLIYERQAIVSDLALSENCVVNVGEDCAATVSLMNAPPPPLVSVSEPPAAQADCARRSWRKISVRRGVLDLEDARRRNISCRQRDWCCCR